MGIGDIMKAYIYIRQSTKKQARSGLSVEAQRRSCGEYAELKGHTLMGEVVETASGANDERKELLKLMAIAKKNDAIILVSTLDRLSRKVSFIAGLMDKGVRFVCVDLGDEVPSFMLHLFAAYAEMERTKISQRTKAALREAKRRGTKLGNPRWEESINKARDSRYKGKKRWEEVTKKLVKSLVMDEKVCYNSITIELNEMGYKSWTGGVWYRQSVKRLMDRTKES